ncbi:NUDIX hydrolase [Chitinispirillum alkaliphilum]|nr:NUDIX hydrolase [Chitinispirillum alkaliphilum]
MTPNINELHPKKITPTTDVKEIDWDSWEFTEQAVLCFVRDNDQLMLIHKKTGLGKGKINAPGGRIEQGETPLEAAVRETEEETGIIPKDLVLMADLQFIFTDGYSLRGKVFFAASYTGVMANTPEADPFWCPVHDIPYARMWADDILWLPPVLKGKKMTGRFIFDNDTMLSHQLLEGI